MSNSALPENVRSIFIRIPKTGSTSIVSAISELQGVITNNKYGFLPVGGERYLYHSHLRTLGAEIMCSAYSFSFVRNPYDRAVSSWKYLAPNIEFKRFLSSLVGRDLEGQESFDRKSWHCCLQTPHIMDSKGENLVDFLGKFENLQEDFDHVMEVLNLPNQKLPWLARSKRGPYRDYYDKGSRDLVKKIYARDLERLDYRF